MCAEKACANAAFKTPPMLVQPHHALARRIDQIEAALKILLTPTRLNSN